MDGLATNTSISDLGIPVATQAQVKLLHNSRAFSQLRILRLDIFVSDAGEIWEALAEALTSSDCNIRFLDLMDDTDITIKFRSGADIFWRSLAEHDRKINPLQALRISMSLIHMEEGFHSLANYLCSTHCSLLWLECRPDLLYSEETKLTENEEWQLANSLENNFSLCTLSFVGTPWVSPAAKARANSFINRNVRYRSGQLLQEPQVKPSVAKLFLCGHGESGKTTLCRTLLLDTARRRASSAICGPLLHRLKPTSRTRGMEFHSLLFKQGSPIRSKLVICDLAGQEEYHTFHHFFITASNKDLFVVMCKLLRAAVPQEKFERELQYWLRFIVAHKRRPGQVASLKPKVIVVVNFFYPSSVKDMADVACERAHPLMKEFSSELDFGPIRSEDDSTDAGEQYENLFGLAANKAGQVQAVKRRLGVLLEELLESGHSIPRLCSDIADKVLPSLAERTSPLMSVSRKAKPPLFLPYKTIEEKYCRMFSVKEPDQEIGKRIRAALSELHNQGVVVFFPKEEAVETGNTYNGVDDVADSIGTLVITDNGWFCNKFIGNLLATYLDQRVVEGHTSDAVADVGQQEGPSVWRIEDIKSMLRGQGCKTEHLQEMVRYLVYLDLCFSYIEKDDTKSSTHAAHSASSSSISSTNYEQRMLLFPALVRKKTVEYPRLARNITDGTGMKDDVGSEGAVTCFGRRLGTESSLHLIPSGVFTRLQVRLRRLCDNESYNLGYCWASFTKGNVGAVVRFGGSVIEAWENKQWIDILVFCPNVSHHAAEYSGRLQAAVQESASSHNASAMNAAGKLMIEIKTLIYEMCEPIGLLQEWVLYEGIPNVGTYAMPVADIKAKVTRDDIGTHAEKLAVIKQNVREKGLEECYVYMRGLRAPIHVVELLLPTELQAYVQSQLSALAAIQAEFSATASFHGDESRGYGKRAPDDDDSSDVDEARDLTSEQLNLWKLIKPRLQKHDRRIEDVKVEMHKMTLALQEIRNDIRLLGECLRQAERDIIANCSTRLMRHELRKDHAHPKYPYLVNASDQSGKLRPLKDLLRKKGRLHFLCESPNGGPHVVEGQKGKEITLEVNEVLQKVARVMIPTLKVMCCLARIAATIYLPGAHVFIPSPDFLDGLGITGAALQQEILPKAIEAFCDGVHIEKYGVQLVTQKGFMPAEELEMKASIQGMLKKDQSIDMLTDFSLERVCVGDTTTGIVCWVCDEHKFGTTPLAPTIANPFAYD